VRAAAEFTAPVSVGQTFSTKSAVPTLPNHELVLVILYSDGTAIEEIDGLCTYSGTINISAIS